MKIYIQKRLYKSIGVNIYGNVTDLPIHVKPDDPIGVLHAYEQLPEDADPAEFQEASI